MALTDLNVSGHVGAVGAPNSPLAEVIAQYNDLAAKFETLLEKLDADAGVTDADYESTVGLTKRIVLASGAPTAG